MHHLEIGNYMIFSKVILKPCIDNILVTQKRICKAFASQCIPNQRSTVRQVCYLLFCTCAFRSQQGQIIPTLRKRFSFLQSKGSLKASYEGTLW